MFLHGILGTGANLHALAKRFTDARPDTAVVLPDLRMHGRSQGFAPPHGIAACADDLAILAGELGAPITTLLGHSFGGKVALALGPQLPALEHLVVVDSTPSERPDARGSEGTLEVIDLLDRLPATFPTREAFTEHVLTAGQSKAIAAWLAMNLERTADGAGVRFRLDMKAVHELLDDYLATDAWGGFADERVRRDLVVGGKSRVVSDADRERARAMGVRVTVLPGASHWVHVDDPEGLARVILGLFFAENSRILVNRDYVPRRSMRRSLFLPVVLVACGGTPSDPGPAPVATASAPIGTAAASASASAPPAASSAPVATPEKPRELGPPDDGTPRVYAKSRFVWVHYEPSAASGWMGFLWVGGYAKLASTTPVPGNGDCPAWYAVEPRGFVCVDGSGATLDRHDPGYVSLLPFAPDLSSAYPHRYGESKDAQRYFSLPTEAEQRAREWDYPEQMQRIAAAKNGDVAPLLQGVDLSDNGEEEPLFAPFSPTLREQRKRIVIGSTITWTREVRHDNRSFLLTADYAWVPKDRVAPYPTVTFHGVELKDEWQLPIAFVRQKPRPSYARDASGAFRKEDGEIPRLAMFAIEEPGVTVDGVSYVHVRNTDRWLDVRDVTIARATATPWGAPPNEEDRTGRAPAGRATWLDVSVLGGTLVAYEGTKPVYATMIAPGRGGVPEGNKDPVSTASTPTGTWPVSGKFATAMMVTDETLIHSDVPWTQNFHGPHALHGAYWHDGWGEKKSGGCVNLAPIDGRWLFYWTEPALPEGWHGMRSDSAFGRATTVVVHK